MKYSALLIALLTVLGLSACEKPTTVNVPPANSTTVVPGPAVAVPGPAGPTGATGATGSPGYDGAKGDTGKTGGDVVIVPVPVDR